MQVDPLLCSIYRNLPKLPSNVISTQHFAQRVWILAGIALFAFPGLPARSQQPPDLTQKSIEDLMKTKISSVSKKEEQLLDTPAAVYVVTREEIRSAGARNVPDALRLVPGMDVNRINASVFDVGIRGFDERFSNKMLVMIDGRSLYSPIFGGIYWDSISLSMDDIDRIEVIRGPGGSLWGTNAVNGTVNIITRSSQATQGVLLRELSSSDIPMSMVARYGGQVGKIGTYRIFSKYQDSFGNQDATGQWAGDAWHLLHGGFRSDLKLRQRDVLMLEGNIYSGSFGEPLNVPIFVAPFAVTVGGINSVTGGSVMGRWTHSYVGGQQTQAQIYYAIEDRNATERPDNLDTVDVDLQHHFHVGSRQDIVGGAGYRYSKFYAPATRSLTITPAHQDYPLYSAFIQDEIALVPRKFSLTAGGKTEHNRFTSFDFQPSLRLNWRPSDKTAVWASATQAVKIPNFLNTSMYRLISVGLGADGIDASTLVGNPNYKDEHLLAYESGYRLQLKRMSIDATGFVNNYSHVETNESLAPTARAGYTEYPAQWANNLFGKSFGAEAAATWNVIPRWKMTASYSWLKLETKANSQSNDTSSAIGFNTGTPTNHYGVRSSYALRRNLDFNALAQYTGPLPSGLGGNTAPALPSYCRVDGNLQWHVGDYVRLDMGGQNLLSPRMEEYNAGDGAIPTMAPRNIFGRITYVF
ncbi:MAG: TonB-dependent receptor [Terracidiphilus sp.]|jgi:iron complex outermembrane receptor protein